MIATTTKNTWHNETVDLIDNVLYLGGTRVGSIMEDGGEYIALDRTGEPISVETSKNRAQLAILRCITPLATS